MRDASYPSRALGYCKRSFISQVFPLRRNASSGRVRKKETRGWFRRRGWTRGYDRPSPANVYGSAIDLRPPSRYTNRANKKKNLLNSARVSYRGDDSLGRPLIKRPAPYTQGSLLWQFQILTGRNTSLSAHLYRHPLACPTYCSYPCKFARP